MINISLEDNDDNYFKVTKTSIRGMVVIINGMLLGVRTSRPTKTLFDAVTRRKFLSTRHHHNGQTSNSLKRAATKICIGKIGIR